jgi:general secretion pathway protein A
MYMNFYQFREEPFGITPDPRFLFLSSSHRDALAAMVYGVSQRKGFISVIGEVGTGKTIVLRAFLERLDRSTTTAICLLNPLVSFDQIIDEVLPPDFQGSSGDRYRTLQEWLINEYREGRNVVVAIDEAQRMPAATLEKLRLLSNLETTRHKLIQIILVGQPELERKLRHNDLRQLWQRIAVRATIWPLTRIESRRYITHRLSKVAAGTAETVFTRAALRHLISRAGGNPRRLNVLCDRALVSGFNRRRRPVPLGTAWQVTASSTAQPRWWQTAARRAGVSVTMIVMLAALVLLVLTTQNRDESTAVALAVSTPDVAIAQPDDDAR